MHRGLEVKKELANVDCASFLQRLILPDPDPTSPLYIPLPPERRYETLSQAIESGNAVDDNPVAKPKTMEANRGVNIKERRAGRSQDEKSSQATQSNMGFTQSEGYSGGLDFGKDDQFSMGGDDFGKDDPFSMGGEDFVKDEPFSMGGDDPFAIGASMGDDFGEGEVHPEMADWGSPGEVSSIGGTGESMYPDNAFIKKEAERQRKMIEELQKSRGENEEDEEIDIPEIDENEDEYGEGEKEGEEDERDYRYSEPMYTPADEELRRYAIEQRKADDIKMAKESQAQTGQGEDIHGGDTTTAAEGTVPDETGTEPAQEGEVARPKRRLKEKFMKDREELERYLNSQGASMYSRPEDPEPPGEDKGDPNDYTPGAPSRTPPRGTSRIMSGQELKQQMAFQKLATAALKAMGSKGKGKKGKMRVMFL